MTWRPWRSPRGRSPRSIGWPETGIRDVGPLSGARGLEAAVLFWVTVRLAVGHNRFNFHITQSGSAPSS